MKKKVFFAIFTIVFASVCQAQTASSVLSKLVEKVWTYRFQSDKDYPIIEMRFSATEQNIYYSSEKWEKGEKHPFYLSDDIVTTFDESKIGNVSDGKYIVTKETSKDQDVVYCYEIIELSSSTLTFRRIANGTPSYTITLYN